MLKVPLIIECGDVSSQLPFRKCQTLSKLLAEVRLPNDSKRSEIYNEVKCTCNLCQPAVLCVSWFQIFFLYPDYPTIRQIYYNKRIRTVLTLHMCDNISVSVDCNSVPMRSHTSVDPIQDLTEPPIFSFSSIKSAILPNRTSYKACS